MAQFEAQILLSTALGVTRTSVLARTYPPPADAQLSTFSQLIARRAARVPLAYLRGTQEFYGLSFAVSPAVLIPRPETELLVTFALEMLPGAGTSADAAVVADIGTGSGCIAVAVTAQRADVRVLANDISPAAIQVARSNAASTGADGRIHFVVGSAMDCFAACSVDLVLSNPPYIPDRDIETLQPEVRDHEPRGALSGGQDGLDTLRKVAAGAYRVLRPGAWAAVEVGAGQAPHVVTLMGASGLRCARPIRDLAGIERVVAAQKPERP